MDADKAFYELSEEIRKCQANKRKYPEKIIMSASLARDFLYKYHPHFMPFDGVYTLYGIRVEIVPDFKIVWEG